MYIYARGKTLITYILENFIKLCLQDAWEEWQIIKSTLYIERKKERWKYVIKFIRHLIYSSNVWFNILFYPNLFFFTFLEIFSRVLIDILPM